jgi:sarcosine oxidase subunit alpha
MARIAQHPILSTEHGEPFVFTFQRQTMRAHPGETIASALFANGVRIFGRHPKDGSPQGLFCANGQCAQCLVLADGVPVKACMTPVAPEMHVEALNGLPELPKVSKIGPMANIETIEVPVLIIGGGPAGMSAAVELARHGVKVLLVDDKQRLGGKLVLQTHRFFGSISAVYAGTRGIDIATRLEHDVRDAEGVDIWLDTTAVAIYSDQKVGVLRNGRTYVLIRPQVLLVATGAREKSLAFKGNTLPGVYGAGAFQTLVNRDLIKAADRLFIVGGGNVGLITGYHALQAGIQVVGLVEALPECGGYKVHKDKLARFGVPIYTSHTIVSANGREQVDSITIAQVDRQFRPIPKTEKSFACDTVLIAVGLDPVDEFYHSAKDFGMTVFSAGDAEEIAEASAAIFAGKIKGFEIARALGTKVDEMPKDWVRTSEILKSAAGRTIEESIPDEEEGIFPAFHCSQEIPCNPCTSVCPQGLLYIDPGDIRHIPKFRGEELGKACIGCERCITICPGLAITLVDYRESREMPTVTLPYEFSKGKIREGDRVTVVDTGGTVLGEVDVVDVREIERNDRTVLIRVKAPKVFAKRVAGIRVQEPCVGEPLPEALERLTDDTIVCRCERVTAGEIRALIRQGYRDVNEIKTVTRAGMGACGGKTCSNLILRLFREEGIPLKEVTENVKRPLFVEVPMGIFAGVKKEGGRAPSAL